MLDHDERRRLGHIETWLQIDDPTFADGLRRGQPHAPREYRRWPGVLLVMSGLLLLAGAGVAGFALRAPTVALLLAGPGVAGTAAGARLWLRRRLDRPAGSRRRRRG